jgi:hypothetical protein
MKHMTGKQQIGQVHTQLGAEKPKSVEFDPFELGSFVDDWTQNTAAEYIPDMFGNFAKWFPEEKYGVFKGKYGNEARNRIALWATVNGAAIIGPAVGNMVRSTLHGALPSIVDKPKDGPMFDVPSADKLAGGLIKMVTTGVAKKYLTNAWAPKPPPAMVGGTPAPAAPTKPGPQFLGKDVTEVAKGAASFGVSYAIGKVYDQTVGPIVLKQINSLMGKGDAEIPKAKPMTPGGVASTVASAFLSGMLMRPVSYAPLPGVGAGGFATSLGQAAFNGLITTAFDSVYGRSVGPAISDAVNGMAGIAPEERDPASMPAERLARTVARGAVSGTAYYMVDGLTQGWFGAMGASLGGPLGGIVVMAGPAVAGMAAGTVVDAIGGEAIGKLVGSLWSSVTGKPMAEDRPPAPKKEEPGAAPAPAAGAAPAAAPAPAAGAAPAGTQAAVTGAATVSPAPAKVPGKGKKKATPQQLAATAVAA